MKWDIIDNLFWIIPSIISAIMIIFVIINTNKQIKNHNKENHRPYLIINDINDSHENFFNAFISFKNNEKLKPNNKPVNINIIIKNMGYGIATNILLLGFASTVISRAGIDEKMKTGKLFSVLDIAEADESNIKISLISNDNSTETTFDLMLFYTDLNRNIYSTMLLIQVKNEAFWNLYYYPKGSLNFDGILAKRNVNYNNIVRKYRKLQVRKN